MNFCAFLCDDLDQGSLGSRFMKGTDKSTLGKDSSVPLMNHDQSAGHHH